MINILGKVNKHNFKRFTNSDFPGYEVFLGSEDDFKFLPEMARHLNIISVHEPAKNFDLASIGAKGKQSYRLMISLLSCLKKLDFKGVMVIHGAFYNEKAGERKICLITLAKRLDCLSVLFPKIKISLESDILFFNQILDNRAIMALPEDFLELKKYLKSRLYITLDFEHALISSLFQDFVSKHKKYYQRIKNLDDLAKPATLEIKSAWLGYIKKNKNRYDKIFYASLKKYERFNGAIIHFHLSPSDMFKYWYDERIFAPLKGEHLSVKQGGDKLNYRLIKSFLLKLSAESPANVVIEIWPRKAGRYVKELKQSGKLLKKIWRIKK